MLQKGFLDIFLLALLWGPSFLFIKIAIRDIAPLSLVSLRVGFGALLLFAVLKLKGMKMPWNKTLWKHGLILGFFTNGLPFICFNYALLSIPTSLSSLINGTTPVLTVLLANMFLQDEKLTWNRAFGVMMGLSGFVVLFLPRVFGDDLQFDTMGMLLSFLGSTCYAIGMVCARKYVHKSPPFVMPILQLFTSLFYMVPLAFLLETPLDVLKAPVSAWACVMGLAVLGTMLAYILYYRIILKQGATALSMVTYLLPILGTMLGVLFLEETITRDFYLASFLILFGVMIMNGLFRIGRRQHKMVKQ